MSTDVLQETRNLLFGPYAVPAVQVGGTATCKACGTVRVTAISGPIRWPRCTPIGPPRRRGRSQLLVDDELIRAVSNESNIGFSHWFGVNVKTCTRIRQQFGVLNTPGSVRLHQDAVSHDRPPRHVWSKEMIALLGTASDAHVSWHLKRSEGTVRKKRQALGIPTFISPFSPRGMGIKERANRPPDYFDRPQKWQAFRDKFIIGKTCAACGYEKFLDVHHVLPIHIRPDLEFVESNLLVLCDDKRKDCHHRIGHCFHWKSYNPNAIEDAAASLRSIQGRIFFA